MVQSLAHRFQPDSLPQDSCGKQSHLSHQVAWSRNPPKLTLSNRIVPKELPTNTL